jgi:hypothetical protein
MNSVIYLFVAAVVVLSIYLGLRYFLRTSAKFRGARVITCPETGHQAMVEVDASHAALTSLAGQTEIRLESCWRWPLNKDCGQECIGQLDVAPPECLVRSVLSKWYRGKKCAFCDRPFADIQWFDHKPALICTDDGRTVDWREVSMPELTAVMATHLPVCWNCHIARTFKREHPDLVVERPAPRRASMRR